MLLEQVIEGAQQMGYPAVTLTTFREVPWNAPFYTRLGFTMLDELTLPAGLAAKREQETRHGLPPESRCAMRLSAVASGADFSGEYGTKYHSKLTR
jgi:N-acetylglutamate synthase-like GNAT family acetyltransferase